MEKAQRSGISASPGVVNSALGRVKNGGGPRVSLSTIVRLKPTGVSLEKDTKNVKSDTDDENRRHSFALSFNEEKIRIIQGRVK